MKKLVLKASLLGFFAIAMSSAVSAQTVNIGSQIRMENQDKAIWDALDKHYKEKADREKADREKAERNKPEPRETPEPREKPEPRERPEPSGSRR